MKAHDKKTGHEYLWVVLISLGIVAAASVPYIVGYAITPAGYHYLGFSYDFDDICAYLSWMRQAAEGHFFLQNLFTTEPQSGHGFNLLFFVLGSFARVTHLPPEIVFHLARVVFGFLLLLATYKFSGIWLKDSRSRIIGLLMVGLSAGFGGYFLGRTMVNSPVDLWQPEAITFLSIYFSPLFTLPMILMIGSLYFLFKYAEGGDWKNAAYAGLMLFLLANIHTYDLIPMALVWLLYSIHKGSWSGFRAFKGGLIASVVALPMVAYQAYFYMSEPVFRARAAVPTLSFGFHWYVLGYGFLVPLAGIAIWAAKKEKRDLSLLTRWVIAGFISAYLPLPFQRKLIMGTHIPFAILGTLGLVWLMDHLKTRHKNVLPIVLIFLMLPSNLRFLLRDTRMLQENRTYTAGSLPYVTTDEMDALRYLKDHGKPDDIILAHPGFSCIIPSHAGLRVYCGHWGETADFGGKLAKMFAFFKWDTPDQYRLSLLQDERITYVVEYHKGMYWRDTNADFATERPKYLIPVFESEVLTVYRVYRRHSPH